MKTDRVLRDELERELDSDSRINATHVSVAVKDGIATLVGYVTSVAEHEMAEAATKQLRGIRAVVDDMDVVLPGSSGRTDLEIAEACANALDDRFIGVLDEKINVVVRKGCVTLSGHVSWQFVKDAAVKAICELADINKITDNIEIKSRALVNHRSSGIGHIRTNLSLPTSPVIRDPRTTFATVAPEK